MRAVGRTADRSSPRLVRSFSGRAVLAAHLSLALGGRGRKVLRQRCRAIILVVRGGKAVVLTPIALPITAKTSKVVLTTYGRVVEGRVNLTSRSSESRLCGLIVVTETRSGSSFLVCGSVCVAGISEVAV